MDYIVIGNTGGISRVFRKRLLKITTYVEEPEFERYSSKVIFGKVLKLLEISKTYYSLTN